MAIDAKKKEFKPRTYMHEEVYHNIIYKPNIVLYLCAE